MDWIQFSLFIGAFTGMYLSLKSDAKNDRNKASEDRKDLISIMKNSEKETRDFHGRLCTLEEKYIQMMQRFMEKK